MKGHSTNSRFRLKTKTVHGVKTGQHNNPHVMKAAARADGGMCEGKPASKNLGRMGRKRIGKFLGGSFDVGKAGAALQETAKLGLPNQQDAKPAAADPNKALTDQSKDLERQTAALGSSGPPAPHKSGGAVKKADGGGVAEEIDEELKEHEMEHELLAAADEEEADEGDEFKRGGRAKKKG